MPAYIHTLPRAVSFGSLVRLFARILDASALARSRRSLLSLDDHQLRDIGISRDEAIAEASRTRWDAPSHWTV